ncbi:hypothetical protein CR983_03535 [Candidatus Saccharibacteria bacterium]|nr:MAG: hypothetical protein CR983_03535 [Candidatus Saccharibacteria bacterium]
MENPTIFSHQETPSQPDGSTEGGSEVLFSDPPAREVRTADASEKPHEPVFSDAPHTPPAEKPDASVPKPRFSSPLEKISTDTPPAAPNHVEFGDAKHNQ